MSFFDLFSGQDGRESAIWSATQAQQTQQLINSLLQQSQTQALDAIDAGEPRALEAMQSAYDTARGDYDAAKALFSPYTTQGLDAWRMMGNATGLYGADGNAAATSAFRASPGYQWSVDQATDAVARKAAALGVAGSGNTMAAISDRAGHMADQEYGDWYNRLSGISDRGYDATGKVAAITTGQGDLASRLGQSTADLYSSDAARRAAIFGGTGTAMANAASNTGNQVMQAGQNAFQAGQEGTKNTWNALMGAANIATSFYKPAPTINLAGTK